MCDERDQRDQNVWRGEFERESGNRFVMTTIDGRECRCFFLFAGTQRYHLELEEVLAEFLGVDSCLAFGMVGPFFLVSYLI